jgi:hypothetical protein
MTIKNGFLQLVARDPSRDFHKPIAHFLYSLAEDRGSKAIAVILSGADADGTEALHAIKAGGGIVIAQDPALSKFNTMPTAAVKTGLVDFILPAERIAQELIQIAHHPGEPHTAAVGESTPPGDSTLASLYAILKHDRGVDFDLRRAQPYSSYEDFQFVVPVETGGDCFARYRVRMVEFRESIKIVRQALDGLPEGPISSRPGVKSVGQVRVAKGEGYARVEGPRGEVGCYLVSDGGPKPYRLKWRGASFSNLSVLPHIIPGHKVADVVAIMGSVDPVFGEVDR